MRFLAVIISFLLCASCALADSGMLILGTSGSGQPSRNPANYVPGGTTVFWIRGDDTSLLLDGSDQPVIADGTIAKVKDAGTGAEILTQTTAGSRPIYRANLASGRGGIEFPVGRLLNFPAAQRTMLAGATTITMGYVVKSSASLYGGLSLASTHYAVGNWNSLYSVLVQFKPTSAGATAANGWTISPMLDESAGFFTVWIQYGVVDGTMNVRINNTLATRATGNLPTANPAGYNTDTPASADFGWTGGEQHWFLQYFLIKNAPFPTATQRDQWHTDMKALYGLTGY